VAVAVAVAATSDGARADYVIQFDGTFAFAAPVERVWSSLARLDCYPTWWTWLHDFSVDGPGLKAGSALHGVVVPPLPYRMRIDVVLDELVPDRFIGARIHGDLEGTAQIGLARDGVASRVRATWTIEMRQRALRLAARFGYPLLKWGHDRVVEATVDSFRRHLADERAA
jgi:hypothetical protein